MHRHVMLDVLPDDWTFGEKRFKCSRSLARRLKLVRSNKRETKSTTTVHVEVVTFVQNRKVFHGYATDEGNAGDVQRRLWLKISYTMDAGRHIYYIHQAGIVRSERKIRLARSAGRALRRKNATEYRLLTQHYRAQKKRKIKTKFDDENGSVAGSSLSSESERFFRKTPTSCKRKRRKVSNDFARANASSRPKISLASNEVTSKLGCVSSPCTSDANRMWMGLPVTSPNPEQVEAAEETTPLIPCETVSPTTPCDTSKSHARACNGDEATECDKSLLTMLQNMIHRERKENATRAVESMRRLPSDHEIVDVTRIGDVGIAALRKLAAENYETTGSIPFPEPPVPAVAHSGDLLSKWTSKRQRVALLRCRRGERLSTDENRSKGSEWIGYISWIEFVSADSSDFVVPPIISQIYVTASHRGTEGPCGGNFGKRMLEWVVNRLRPSCQVLTVSSPNKYSQRMLKSLGWHEADPAESFPACSRAGGRLFLRFQTSSAM